MLFRSMSGNQVRFTWNGGSGSWNDPTKWDLSGAQTGHRAPTYVGVDPSTDDSLRGFVCVAPASSATITLDDSSHVHVQALEVSNATLVATTARVMVYAAPGTHPSTIHANATVRLHESTLGGPGRLDVEGHVVWGEAGFGVGTLDNDHCADFPVDEVIDACPAPTPATGTLRVASGGLLDVSGRGVNLSDGYAVDVQSGGRLRISGSGYVAADRDTAITIESGGTLELAGDSSVFEGKANSQPDTDLAELINNGTVLKSAGSGASALNVDYTGSGKVDVRTGGLSIAGTAPITGDLRAGARLRSEEHTSELQSH